MQPEDIVEMGFDARYTGRRPSSEWRFHRDILAARPEVGAVLHCHSTYATTLACHHRGIPAFHYMVAVAGGADIRCAPYATFGTQALSDAALAALEGRRACLLGQHGMIALGATPEKALALAVEVEVLARMYVQALTLGAPPVLDEAEMARVLEQFRRMSYGQPVEGEGVETARLR
jgi:L-fuculose-phosphate aldolase